jgi:hypothetical protein
VHSLTSALNGGEWLASRSGRLIPQGKSPPYPLDRRQGGAQSRSGRGGEEKNSQPAYVKKVKNLRVPHVAVNSLISWVTINISRNTSHHGINLSVAASHFHEWDKKMCWCKSRFNLGTSFFLYTQYNYGIQMFQQDIILTQQISLEMSRYQIWTQNIARLSWLSLSWFCSCTPNVYWERTSQQNRAVSFHIPHGFIIRNHKSKLN